MERQDALWYLFAYMQAGSKPNSRPEPRPLYYGVIDLLLALCYAVLWTVVVPSNQLAATCILWAVVVVFAVTGTATLTRRRWTWSVAVWGCIAQLVLVAVIFALIVASAAFLAGVYGAYGRAASMLSLLLALVSAQALGLVPALQLKFLMTRAGRAAFGRPT